METKKMNKAKEILYKHAKNNGCKYVLSRNPFLKQAVLNAINEALVGPSEQLPCPYCAQPFIREEIDGRDHCFNCGWEF